MCHYQDQQCRKLCMMVTRALLRNCTLQEGTPRSCKECTCRAAGGQKHAA